MKIYTSYWAMVRNFPRNLVGLNTTMWPPRWRKLGKDKQGVWVVDCPILKPGPECAGLCNGKCAFKHPDNCAFLETYYNQLMRINFKEFTSSLIKLHNKICQGENLNDIDFALIVYEKWDNPCSERRPLQEWLHANDIDVEEWFPNI